MMEIKDLRNDLKQLPEFKKCDLSIVPDAIVVLLHDQYSTLLQEGAPPYLVSLITTWIALERNGIQDYEADRQAQDAVIQQQEAIIEKLREHIRSNGYAQAGHDNIDAFAS